MSDSSPDGRKRILFIGEAVTLAHVARPMVLAHSLPQRYDIHFACALGYEALFSNTHFTRWQLHSIPSERFLRALAFGSRVYDRATLTQYVSDDLQLIDAVQPDLIVGDFRLSLAVSAPMRGVPYVNITNAHWSPYATSQRFPIPEHPATKVLGAALANGLFHFLQPAIFAYHGRPLNSLLRAHGLPPIGDLRQVYTQGDYAFYADVPALIPCTQLPDTHRYLGPILWSPEIPFPSWWQSLPNEEPCVYVTLGSSGQVDLLPTVVAALSELPVSLMVATAGRIRLPASDRVYSADYIPGIDAVRRARLVICNGGSGTAYQALCEGVPVLGIASNMDQYLTMAAVERVGAGVLIRAGQADRTSVRRGVERLMSRPEYSGAARRIADDCKRYEATTRFRQFVEDYFGEGH